MPVSAALPTPTQNTGAHAQGALYAAQAMEGLKKAAAMLNPTSPLGQAVLDALKKIGKEVGAAPPETQMNSLQSQLVEAKRNAMQRMALMQQMQHGGQQQQQPQPQPQQAAQPQPQAAMAA